MEFLQGIKVQYKDLVTEANGQEFIPWAAALAIAGRPRQEVAMWSGQPARELMGGAVVAVDMNGQRTWLPILDARNQSVPFSRLNARDVSDAINRCRAKAVAMVLGVGLGQYEGQKDAASFLCALNVRPDSDLALVQPLVGKKGGASGAAYVSWQASLAACRITDSEYSWAVIEQEVSDPATGEVVLQPYLTIGSTFMVALEVKYKGQTHIELLPIMGTAEVNGKKRDHVPLGTPTPFDWNKAVMRCLAKANAVVSGYGLSIYAKEDLEALQTTFVGKAPQEPVASVEDLIVLRDTLTQAGRTEEYLMNWFSKPGAALESLTAVEVERAMHALRPKAA